MNTTSDPIGESDVTGTTLEVSDSLKPTKETKYAISSGRQALAVARTLREDWSDGIINTTIITAQLNGQPPRDMAKLEQMGRGWYPNINTGSLRSETSVIPERFSTPILTAKSLTPASLPVGYVDGPAISERFRTDFTNTLRSWDKFQWWVTQSCREVGVFGFCFATFFDEWEWRPTFIRQDQGFIPIGLSVFDKIPTYAVMVDYQPWELIDLVESATKNKDDSGWKVENVAKAINAADLKAKETDDINSRRYEEMIRAVTVGKSYEKGFKTIKTFHVFSTDPDGTISHHIVVDDGPSGMGTDEDGQSDPLLFERRDQFKAMDEVVIPLVFALEDGTIHGCQGAGQLLFELSIEFEKCFNDWIAANRMLSKIKAQTQPGTNADEVRMKVEDYMMVLDGAIFAGNLATVVTDPKPFQAILQGIGLQMSKKLGDVVPPIPLTPDDIRAAQMDQKVKEQQASREKLLLNWLLQIGRLVRVIGKRMCKAGTPDDEATEFQKRMKAMGCTREMLDILSTPPVANTIMDFTEYAIQKRAAFAQAKGGNAYYDQRKVERVQAVAVGGDAFADYVMHPGVDPVGEKAAKRQQQSETATMRVTGNAVDVIPTDQHFFHMQDLKPVIEETLQSGALDLAQLYLNHYTGHYIAGMATKQIPGDGNADKQFIFRVQKVLETGQMPPEGLGGQPDLLAQIESQMVQPSQPSETPDTGPIARSGLSPDEVATMPITAAQAEAM